MKHRVKGLSLVLVVLSLLAAAPASASFGYHGVRYITCCQMSGSRAKITTPSTFSVPSGSNGLMFVTGVNSTGDYAIAAGFADCNGCNIDGSANCGPFVNYVEQTSANVSHCYYAGGASFNTTLKYSVQQISGGWQGYVSGVAKGPVLNWLSAASSIQAGGEVGSAGVSITGRFAYPDLQWQAYDGAAWINVTSPGWSTDSTGWSTGGTFPSDWTVTHS
jgi:hypothetical protein